MPVALVYLQGNQENRIVIYDNKIIDYINFIMRAGDFEDCSADKVTIEKLLATRAEMLVGHNLRQILPSHF